MVEYEGVRKMLDKVHEQRKDAWLGEAEIRVTHNGGAECQKEMRRIYTSLTAGATMFYGTYHCDDCDVTVSVRLRAHPDVPHQIYKQDEREVGP